MLYIIIIYLLIKKVQADPAFEPSLLVINLYYLFQIELKINPKLSLTSINSFCTDSPIGLSLRSNETNYSFHDQYILSCPGAFFRNVMLLGYLLLSS